MSPEEKIAYTYSLCQHRSDPIRCPYCNFQRCWRHGNYMRKGFHSPLEQSDCILRPVQRHICRNSSCERTFSVLPRDVLPYCRFFWHDLVNMAGVLEKGTTAYSIAKYHWHVSIRVILRAQRLIRRVRRWLEELCRESGYPVSRAFATLAATARGSRNWYHFSRIWFHRLYPGRVDKILNPQNLGIKPA